MGYHDHWTGTTFGTDGISDLLTSLRETVENPDACETLYNNARSVTLQLVRGDRGADEVKLWKSCFSIIEAFALARCMPDLSGSGTEHVPPIHLTALAHRFEVLKEQLNDQVFWIENYTFSTIQEVPFVCHFMRYIHDGVRVLLSDCLEAMRLNDTNCLSLLIQHRLATWGMDDGEIWLELTPAGKSFAKKFESVPG